MIVGNISDHNRDGRNKVCRFHHGVMMLIGRLIVMGRLCELHVLLLVDSTWDTFFYRIRFFTRYGSFWYLEVGTLGCDFVNWIGNPG